MKKKAEKTGAKAKPGRKPMTPEEKETAARVRAEQRESAENLRPEIFVQFQGDEVNVASLVDEIKAAFHNEKKRTLVTGLKLYIKPEERTAYYVINDEHTGSIKF